jgi:predicted phosphodiesterase
VRVAVISDVHANLAALEAVLADIDYSEGADEIWCLGDVTGYGARPAECVALVRERAAICLAGNHDLVVSGTLDVATFTADAAIAASYSREHLSEGALDWLRTLEPSGIRHDVELHHGSVRDPVWEYVLSQEAAVACLELQTHDVALVGHSHVALAVHLDVVEGQADELAGGLAPDGAFCEVKPRPWLLNPGSVGQPRDGDWRAAWLLLDLEERTAKFHRTEYDVARTQQEIRDAGLPPRLASRLSTGS